MNAINLEESRLINSTPLITSASKPFVLIEGQGSNITEGKSSLLVLKNAGVKYTKE